MPLILAVEPDQRQASHIAAVLRGRPRTELVIAQSAEAAVQALGGRVPEVLLTSPLLSSNDEGALAAWLRELGPAAAHVQALTIPILAPSAPAKEPRGMLSALRRRRSQKSAPEGCEPAVFADHVGQYVVQAMAARPEQETSAPVVPPPPVVVLAPAAPPEPAAFSGPVDLCEAVALSEPVASCEPVDLPEAVALSEDVAPPEPGAAAPLPQTEPEVVEEADEPVWMLIPATRPARPEHPAAPLAADGESWAAASLEDVTEPPAPAAESPVAAETGESPWMLAPTPEFEIVGEAAEPAVAETAGMVPVLLLAPVYDAAAEPNAPVTTCRVPPEVVRMAPEVVIMAPEPVTPPEVVRLQPGAVSTPPQVVTIQLDVADAPPEAITLPPEAITLPPEVMTVPPEVVPVPADLAATVVVHGPVSPAAGPRTTDTTRRRKAARPHATAKPTAKPATKAASKAARKPPIQDEWGLFDPTQCGFAALLDKLDEVTASSGSDVANAQVSVRIISY